MRENLLAEAEFNARNKARDDRAADWEYTEQDYSARMMQAMFKRYVLPTFVKSS